MKPAAPVRDGGGEVLSGDPTPYLGIIRATARGLLPGRPRGGGRGAAISERLSRFAPAAAAHADAATL